MVVENVLQNQVDGSGERELDASRQSWMSCTLCPGWHKIVYKARKVHLISPRPFLIANAARPCLPTTYLGTFRSAVNLLLLRRGKSTFLSTCHQMWRSKYNHGSSWRLRGHLEKLSFSSGALPLYGNRHGVYSCLDRRSTWSLPWVLDLGRL